LEYVFPRFLINHLYGLFQNEYKEKTRGVGNGDSFFKVARKVSETQQYGDEGIGGHPGCEKPGWSLPVHRAGWSGGQACCAE
jgi:hypothetical protein